MNQKNTVNAGQENRRPLLHRVFGISNKGPSASALAGGANPGSSSVGATSRVVTQNFISGASTA